MWCVELAPLPDGELLGAALADAVGARGTTAGGALKAAIDQLADGRAIVLLDNCEHLLAPVADACEELLRSCPHLTILATSRAPLGLENEVEWRVPPLSLPPEQAPEPLDALWTFGCRESVHRARPRRQATAAGQRRDRPCDRADLPRPGRDPARDRACGRAGGRDVRPGDRGWARRSLPAADRRRARADAPPADAPRVGRLELRAAVRGRASAAHAPVRIRRRLLGGGRRQRLRAS